MRYLDRRHTSPAERAEGKDPLRVRELERQRARLDAARAVTFEQAAKAFIAAREGTWKNDKHRAQWPLLKRMFTPSSARSRSAL
jgi:hypothetical protein